MPITITLLPSNVDGSGSNLFYAIGTLAFSGNYTTGGDTLDFTTVADKLPSTQIIQVFADSQYELIQEEKKQNLELIEQGKRIEQLTRSLLALTQEVRAAVARQ